MNKFKVQKLCIVFALMALCIGFLIFVEMQPRKPENASPLFNKYEHLLKRTKSDVGSLQVYVEPASKYQEYDYYVTVVNISDKFVCGTLQLVTSKDNICFEKRYINIKPYEEKVILINVEYVPTDYKWKQLSFYDFEYPKFAVDTIVSYDFDEQYGYYWMNVLSDNKMTTDECLEYATRVYVQDILSGNNSSDIFFYDRQDVVYLDKGNQKYPDINSGYMASAIKENRIQIIDLKNNEIIKEKLLK